MVTKKINERLISTNVDKGEKRKKSKSNTIFNCIIGSVFTVVVVMVIAFMIMLFSSGDDGRRETFFNTIYFESTTMNNGDVELAFGTTGRFMPIICSIITVAIVYYSAYRIIVKYKKNDF